MTYQDIWNSSNNYTRDMNTLGMQQARAASQNFIDTQGKYANKMGLLGDALMDPNSSQNQFNLRNLSAQFNASMPNYFEIAASQGVGGSIAGMQQAAAKRQAGLLTNANFGTMMQDNQRTALGYYGQASNALASASQAQNGLLGFDYQNQWHNEDLAEKKRQFDESQTSPWLTAALGVGGSLLGGFAGSFGKGLADKVLSKW